VRARGRNSNSRPFERESFSSVPADILRGWGGFFPLALERGGEGLFPPGSEASSVVVVAFSSFIYQHDIIQTVIFLSFILHHTCIFTYIIDTHIFINIHNWVCTIGLNLAHRSQRVQGTITIVKSV
jgi:hypothetical protein